MGDCGFRDPGEECCGGEVIKFVQEKEKKYYLEQDCGEDTREHKGEEVSSILSSAPPGL